MFSQSFSFRNSFLAVVALVPIFSTAQSQQSGRPAAPVVQAPGTAPTQLANTPYAIGAQRNGVIKCINRINQITSFLTANAPNSGMVMNAPGNEVNQKLVSTVIEVENNVGSSYISASFSPGINNSECSGTYDAVTYWTAGCSQVATANFSAFKLTQPLNKNVFTLDGGALVKVFLMPAGTGCVSIKKEILY